MPSREIVSPCLKQQPSSDPAVQNMAGEISGDKTETMQHGPNRTEYTGRGTPYAMVSTIHHTFN